MPELTPVVPPDTVRKSAPAPGRQASPNRLPTTRNDSSNKSASVRMPSEQQGQILRQVQTALQRAQGTNQELAPAADRVTTPS